MNNGFAEMQFLAENCSGRNSAGLLSFFPDQYKVGSYWWSCETNTCIASA